MTTSGNFALASTKLIEKSIHNLCDAEKCKAHFKRQTTALRLIVYKSCGIF